MKIGSDEFCRMFDCKLDNVPMDINQIDTTYRHANIDEFQEYMLYVLRKMEQYDTIRTIDKSLEAFERGWKENLNMLIDGNDLHLSLKPKYFRPNKFLRYNNGLIVSNNLDLEYNLFTIARHVIFTKYLYPFDNIYELGCGSCQNLLSLSELFPSKKLFGFDWTTSSVGIAKQLANTLNRNIYGTILDMTKPSIDITLEHGSAVITIHSLEQIGKQYDELLSFIIRSKPGIVIHYEPMIEFYNDNNLLDYIAMLYNQKRNYLSGFYKELCSLEKQCKIEILEAKRPYLGGIIHESSLIVWRPV